MSRIKDLLEARQELETMRDTFNDLDSRINDEIWNEVLKEMSIDEIDDYNDDLEVCDCLEEVINNLNNYRKEVQWDFKNAETFWKYFFEKTRKEIQTNLL